MFGITSLHSKHIFACILGDYGREHDFQYISLGRWDFATFWNNQNFGSLE
jgi:hypothetical protein